MATKKTVVKKSATKKVVAEVVAAEYINIRAGRLPGKIQEVVLNGDRTVAAALEAAELVAEGYEVRVNGAPASLDTNLGEGDMVLLVKKIKGN